MLCAEFHGLVEAVHMVTIMYNSFYKIRGDGGGGGGDGGGGDDGTVFIYFVLSTLCKCD
jgi:hypothetical protein